MTKAELINDNQNIRDRNAELTQRLTKLDNAIDELEDKLEACNKELTKANEEIERRNNIIDMAISVLWVLSEGQTILEPEDATIHSDGTYPKVTRYYPIGIQLRCLAERIEGLRFEYKKVDEFKIHRSTSSLF